MNCSAEVPFENIILYIPDDLRSINRKEIQEFVITELKTEAELKGDLFRENYDEGIEKKIAGCKVRDKNERKFIEPLRREIEIEKEILDGKKIVGILYDGLKLADLMFDLLPEGERKDHVVAVTSRLIGTLEGKDNRYHARSVINSIPSIISTSGIVEGPAKPRKYYLQGEKEKMLDFRPMEYEDERMTEAVKSYLLQTVFWRLKGDPFCENEGCPLYNSHWQREVINNQVRGSLCEKHRSQLDEFLQAL